MKNLITFVFILLFIGVSAQSIDTDNAISAIRKEYKEINSIKNWQKIKTIFLYESTEGGQVNHYFKNNILRKISAVYYGETGKRRSEFYLKDNKPFFIFETEENYSQPIYMKDFRKNKAKSKITETRTYLKDGKIIQQLKNKNQTPTTNWDESEKEILKEYKNLFNPKINE